MYRQVVAGRSVFQFPISREAAMSATLCGNERGSPQTAKAEQPQRDNNGRDARGRFAAGNFGGPGNPFARRVAEFRQVLHECCSLEDMRYIGGQVVALAKTGDMAATKLLLQYQVGKPAATVDPDTLDLQELALFQRGPTPDEIHALTSGQRMPPDAWMASVAGLSASDRGAVPRGVPEHVRAHGRCPGRRGEARYG
jgi:hypothetical protein